MKQLIKISCYVYCFFVSISAWSQSSKNESWSGWQPIYQESLGDQMVSVLISYRLQSCSSGYTSYYRLKNEFSRPGAIIFFRLVYHDCSGKQFQESSSADLSQPKEFGHSGNWILTSQNPQIVDIRLNGNGIQRTQSQTLASQDMRRKLLATVDEWVLSCANAVAKMHGFPGWPPEPGSIMMAYADDIQNSLQQARQLKKDLTNSTETNLTELSNKLAEVEGDKSSIERKIEQGWPNYQKGSNAVQEEKKREAEQQAQRQADENARLLAAQQQREEEERQRQEAERERRAEAERQRQAQLAANIVLYNDRININNAYTQAKLEEQRRNSTLSDVPKYDSNNAKNTIGGTSTNKLGKQAFGGDGKGYLDGNDDDPPKKSTGRSDSIKYDDDEDETSKKTNSAIAPTASSGCDLTFSAVEAQRLPPVVSVAAIGTKCDADIRQRILDYRDEDTPFAQLYIDQYCVAIQEGARESLLREWHQLQDKRGRTLEKELNDCLFETSKYYLSQFNSAKSGANLCLDKLRNNAVYYQHNRTVVKNLQYRINVLQQQIQMYISPTNPDPNNALNVFRTMSSLGIDICNLANSIKKG